MSSHRIAALFAAFGMAWILLSDRVAELFSRDMADHSRFQSFKGLLFVALSALLIYVLVRRAERRHAELEAQALLQRDRLARILEVSPATIYALRRDATTGGVFVVDFIGPTVEAMAGYPLDDWLATPTFWADHLHPDDRDEAIRAQQVLEAQGELRHEYRFRHADGDYRWVHDRAVLARDPAGDGVTLIGSWLDITDRRRAEEHGRLVAQVFDASQQGIVVTDAQTRLISVNQAFSRITGYSAEEVLGRTPVLLKSGHQDAAFYDAMWAQLRDEGRWEGEIWNRRKDGQAFPEWLTISAIRDAGGVVQQYLGIFTETASRRAAEERIQRLAHYDTLTGLPNRVLLADRAGMALAAASRHEGSVVLMHVNVDHFGGINDALGHEAGDRVLVTLAERLTAVLAPDDTVSRLGGDDFALLLPHADVHEVGPLTIRIMSAVGEALPVAGQVLRLTASIGVAASPDNGQDFAQLSQAAEAAVHQAKREGRNLVRFFSRGLQAEIQETLSLARDLRWAVERNELVLHYQPQFQVQGERLVGMEALVRWVHPERGMVSPGRFIPIAEETGLIKEIGQWVLRQALAQNAAWQVEGLPVVPVAVNLSVVQFRDPRLQDILAEALAASGLPPAMLELELTESVAMEDSDFTIARIQSLRRLGVQLSIDDFGTGYSSLGYLKRFAVHKLKIDQSFVRGLHRDPQDEAIVTTVIALATSLGLSTIAEGVETLEQLDFLRRAGCDEVQGYLLGRPVPAEQFVQYLRRAADRPAALTEVGALG